MRLWLLLIPVLVLALVARGQGTPGGSIFDAASGRADHAVVTIGDTVPDGFKAGQASSPMLDLLQGVLAQLRGKTMEELRATVPPSPFLGDASQGDRVCVVHLYGRDPKSEPRRIEVVRTPAGAFVAVEMDRAQGARPRRAELRRDAFSAVLASWPLYRGGFDDGAMKDPRGEVFELPKPYLPGRFTMDEKTMGERMAGGGKPAVPAADRVLEKEQFQARVPRGYDPRRPAGLLVWIDPMMTGTIPPALNATLDDLGLIAVTAANAGNLREIGNRAQLVFDAVATASQRYHIDPRRVYIAGMSGGGRVASILQGSFPDVFAGCVPIVGLGCFQPVPTGTGRYWAASYNKPKGPIFELLRSRRIAPMTGQKDMNQIEIQHAAEILERDGLKVKLLDYPDMAHELPRPERFSEALGWVDAPYRTARQEDEEAAAKSLETYKSRHGEKPPPDEAARRMLVKVAETAPWSEPAWRAAEVLGLVKTLKPAEGDRGANSK